MQINLIRAVVFPLFLCLSFVVSANDAAVQMIKETTDKMLSTLQAQQASMEKSPAQVYQLVEKIVLPRFDFQRMSKLVLGKNWQSATPEQQNRFIAAFRDLLVRTYAAALAKAAETGVDVTYEPVRAEADAKWVTVKTKVKQADQNFAVDYSVYPQTASDWKIFDVVVEGVSLVTNYRTEFASDVSSIGMDGLIKKIESRNVEEKDKAIKK
jgi:phospholipid transport system substrate-binding protein